MRLAFLIGLLSALGCAQRTEIVVGVATDLKARGQIDSVQFIASREGTPIVMPPPWMLSDQPAGTFELPGSFGIYSQDGSETRVELAVKGYLGSQLITERDSIVSLVSGKTLFMRLAVVGDCGQLSTPTCADGETCVEGVCRPVAVDSHRFPTFRKELVTSTQCDSGTHFVVSSTGVPMAALSGGCEADEYCQEGTCYKLLGGEDGALQQGIWTQQPTPTTYTLRAMWGTPDGADVFAVGDHGTILHLSGAGPTTASSWVSEGVGLTTDALYSLTGSSVNDVWAAGANGTTVHRDATGSWSLVNTMKMSRVDGLFALGSDSVWAAGRTDSTDAVVLHWDGTSWSNVVLPTGTADLRAIWADSDNNVWAVGHGSTVLHGSAGTFTTQTLTATQDFSAISGGGGNMFIAGLGGLVLDADLKTIEDTNVTDDLFGVWVSPSGLDAYAVGDNGRIVALHAGAWREQPSGTRSPLRAVWGSALGDLYAIGGDGVVVHNTGTAATCVTAADCPNVCSTDLLTVRSCTNGACLAASPAPCTAGLACADATTCKTACAGDSDCQGNFYCDPSGTCRAGRAQGTFCDDAEGAECLTAGCRVCAGGLSCTDHVCCGMTAAQCGGCMHCVAGTGTCEPVAYGADVHGTCGASANSCMMGFCNGEGSCGNTGDSCGAEVCDTTVDTSVDLFACQNGTCTESSPSPCPTASPECFLSSGRMCFGIEGCYRDSDCNDAAKYCDANFFCAPRKPKGAACDPSSSRQCASPPPSIAPFVDCNECAAGLVCSNGVCCDKTCTGACEACDVPGSVGTCSLVNGGDPHPGSSPSPCPGTGACKGYCDGTSRTACAVATGECAAATCATKNNFTLKNAASCAAGACPAQTDTSCEPYACALGACLTSCTTNADCASTSPTCNTRTHVCK